MFLDLIYNIKWQYFYINAYKIRTFWLNFFIVQESIFYNNGWHYFNINQKQIQGKIGGGEGGEK